MQAGFYERTGLAHAVLLALTPHRDILVFVDRLAS